MGKVVHAYHGSPHDFDEFSFVNVGKESGTSGAGIGLYFTESKGEAAFYGNNIYECVLTLKQPLSNFKVTLDSTKIANILRYINETFDCDYTENFDFSASLAILNLLDFSESDVEIIHDIKNACGLTDGAILSTLVYFGFDHTIDTSQPLEETITHYIVYNLDSILITNKINIESTYN